MALELGGLVFMVVGCTRVRCIQVRCIVGCALRGGRHRSWRIREPAAARQCVLSELEPKGSDKTACLLRGVSREIVIG
jgi:hypothetical protein